ncbi:MAG: MerR family DNA-binding transcriptional regulator [Alphaproteobacteria bacterium]|nr:MerR family DNA-binding transcriptional regulator [Alphaproteobacteria bacterium]
MHDMRLTIGQMCDLFEVTPRTLRFYEAKELLCPDRIGQRRMFTTRDRARMKLIVRGKRFGFSLEEIRQLLDLYDVDDGQKLQITRTLEIANARLSEMERRRDELDSAIAELNAQIAEGDNFLDHIKPKKNAAE